MKPLIIANWKMNPSSLGKARKLFGGIKKTIKKAKNVEVLIAAPFIWLPFLKKAKLCAQNCFWEEKGPYTGEISPKMIKDMGIEYVIIGHSERRNYFNETDEIINKKLKSVLGAGLIPILCVGERKGENAETVIENQLKRDLDGMPEEDKNKIIIAYEPVWAISTSGGEICSADYAKQKLDFIKQRFNGKIIYGGSVDSKIINDYLGVGYEGALVGGASLKPEEFVKTIQVI
ncbi:MAG: triose-phosphate isomerase [Patescibacteria group bacterium]